MQGQITTNLSKTVKKNLLGLPNYPLPSSNKEVIAVLQEIGMWHIFEEKEELIALIKERGFTFAREQYQQRNFAALYLCALYYCPLLTDEPISSFDKVSKKAIITMISDRAHHAITLVIALRFETLESAQSILNFSLYEKNFIFYVIPELQDILLITASLSKVIV